MSEYLDREQALSFPFANGQYDHENADPHFILGCESYKEWLENLPRADAKPVVHGHIDTVAEHEYCSRCGVLLMTMYVRKKSGDPFGELVLFPNYCPNCGAKMGQKWER